MKPILLKKFIKLSLLCALFAHYSFAEKLSFPQDAGIVNVRSAPYYAKGDGKTDDTKAIQQALNDHPNGNIIIYLPHGTYLVSEQINWPAGEPGKTDYRRTILQGESTDGSVIRLKENLPAYQNPQTPRAVLYTGLGPDQRFRNAIRNLTVRVGNNNPGAIGIRFNASKQGTLHNVTLISEDQNAHCGLDMGYTPEIGPLLVKNLRIKGFETGILTRFLTNSITLENIILQDQGKYGLHNFQQVLSIKGFNYRGPGQAIYNQGSEGVLTLVEAQLENSNPKDPLVAIKNEGTMFLRDIKTQGYSQALDNQGGDREKAPSPDIVEFSTNPREFLCHTPDASLRLPVAETPIVPWGDPGRWVSVVVDYGATVADGRDDSEAIQKAIDDGAETIFFPPQGRFTIAKDIYIRKNVRRVIGTEARIDGSGKFVIAPGSVPTIVFERFDALAGGIIHASSRTLVLKNMRLSRYETPEYGAGDLFLEDVSSAPLLFNNQNVWARQLNIESGLSTKITNNGGRLWILGLSTKNENTIIHTFNGGQTEVLGAHIHATGGAKKTSMFISDKSDLSLAGIAETDVNGNTYHTLVDETRHQDKRKLLHTEVPKRNNGSILNFYTGYIPVTGENEAPVVDAGPDQMVVMPNKGVVTGWVYDDGRAANACLVKTSWSLISGPAKAKVESPATLKSEVSFVHSGTYTLAFAANDGKIQKEDRLNLSVFNKAITTGDKNGLGIKSGRGADALISQKNPRQNYAAEKSLGLSNLPSDAKRLYLRFDISSIPRPITDAYLRLTLTESDANLLNGTVYKAFGILESSDYGKGKLDEHWKESDLNWDSAPANGDQQRSVFLGTLSSFQDKKQTHLLVSGMPLLDLLNKDQNQMVNLVVIRSDDQKKTPHFASKEHEKIPAPTLLLSYIDPESSDVGGGKGYELSEVVTDPFSTRTEFTLKVSHEQHVRVEVFNEAKERVMMVHDGKLSPATDYPFSFTAESLETGNYWLVIRGQAFDVRQPITILK
jgi:hypothetical protein